ncbi:MAG: glucose 1-dehydrogenase [Deltaproteobacteria bacterium]|nr:glucose 1-dehydrogenase [Deltaproteobacteria bacterium]
MSDDLRDQVALVTGGARGIGGAIAALLAARGAQVLIADIDERGAEETARRIRRLGGRARSQQVDVTSDPDLEAMVAAAEAMGPLTVAVNNAGISDHAEKRGFDEADFDRVFAVNLHGVRGSMKHELERMIPRGRGAIVNVASISAFVPTLGAPFYAASKAAVVALTSAAARQVGRYGVRINALCPGPIATSMLETGYQLEEVHRFVPLGRIGEPLEAAEAAAWLCSPAAAFVTGQVLIVDGGVVSG